MKFTLKRARTVAHSLRAFVLARRTRRRWPRLIRSYQQQFHINSTAPVSVYRQFIANFKPFRLGPYTVQMRKTGHESAVMVAATRWIRRKVGKTVKSTFTLFGRKWKLPTKIANKKILLPSNPFRMKFALTSSIEPELPLPIDRTQAASVCVIMGWQGPSDSKYDNTREMVASLNTELKEQWPNRLLRKMVRYSKSQGMQAIALLRPEYNPTLTEENMAVHGDDPKVLSKIKSQFYAVARKTGFKKVEGSRYFWIFF